MAAHPGDEIGIKMAQGEFRSRKTAFRAFLLVLHSFLIHPVDIN
jgi:hypothetical protein